VRDGPKASPSNSAYAGARVPRRLLHCSPQHGHALHPGGHAAWGAFTKGVQRQATVVRSAHSMVWSSGSSCDRQPTCGRPSTHNAIVWNLRQIQLRPKHKNASCMMHSCRDRDAAFKDPRRPLKSAIRVSSKPRCFAHKTTPGTVLAGRCAVPEAGRFWRSRVSGWDSGTAELPAWECSVGSRPWRVGVRPRGAPTCILVPRASTAAWGAGASS
jgi:hypothetical protein